MSNVEVQLGEAREVMQYLIKTGAPLVVRGAQERLINALKAQLVVTAEVSLTGLSDPMKEALIALAKFRWAPNVTVGTLKALRARHMLRHDVQGIELSEHGRNVARTLMINDAS